MSSCNKFLIDFIKQTYPIADPIAGNIAEHFQQVNIAKNDFILRQGRICDNYIILEKGFARAFTYDLDGNDVTTNFYRQPAVIFEVASFFKHTPSSENIMALTPCEGWQLKFEELNHLFHTIPEFREFGRTILVNGFISLKERMLSLINQTSEQRYAQLLHSNPEIVQYAPLKSIASYLGITDTSLSRIRKGISRK